MKECTRAVFRIVGVKDICAAERDRKRERAARQALGIAGDIRRYVRLLACEIARVLPTSDASRVLGELIERETHSNVCSAAIEVLAETGDLASLPILARCAARFPDDPFLTFAVKAASGRIGSSDR